jgi:hypothetical protein
MKKLLPRRPSAAFVLSCIALFVALGGVGYAAATITGKSIRNGTVASADIKDRGIATKDLSKKAVKTLRGSSGPAGPAGPAGPTGATGAAGAAGATNVVVRQSRDGSSSGGGVVQTQATCMAGEKLIGGGGGAVEASDASPASYVLDGAAVTVTLNAPATGNGINEPADGTAPIAWSFAAEIDSVTAHDAVAYAICAKP